MLISIVVPTRDRAQDIGKLLPSIARQTRLPDELIVVDQGKSHETHELATNVITRELSERLVYVHSSAIRGVSTARNVGIALASGDVVVFLDDDVILTADCIEQLESAFNENPDYAGIGGVELQMEHSPLSYILYYDIFFLGPFRDPKYRISRSWRRLIGVQPVTALKTCLAGFRRDFLTEQRFDERWRSALLEDVDLCWRVRGKVRFGIWPKASAWHSISDVRAVGSTGYRATAAAWIFFMRTRIRKEWPLLPLYVWLWIGLLVNAMRRSLASRSFAPAVGLVRGAASLFNPSMAEPFIDMSADPFPERPKPSAQEPGCATCLQSSPLRRISATPTAR